MTNDAPATTATAFQLLWDNLTDLIGTSATAQLVRRAAKHAQRYSPGLAALVIKKPAFEYEYVVPPNWNSDGSEELKALIETLHPLLVELTGMIVLQRLRSIPDLATLLPEVEGE
jgi:hypothetical protein